MQKPSIFLDHYCLRCSKPFMALQRIVTVAPSFLSAPVSLRIHESCVIPNTDQIVGVPWTIPATFQAPPRTWPIFVGEAKHPAFARVMRLTDGVFRLGLHGGHPECWTEEMIKMIPVEKIWRFSDNYSMSGVDGEENHEVLTIPVDYTKFIDMMTPVSAFQLSYSFLYQKESDAANS